MNPLISNLSIVGCCYNCLTEFIQIDSLQEHSEVYRKYTELNQVCSDDVRLYSDDTLVQTNKETHGFPLSTFV